MKNSEDFESVKKFLDDDIVSHFEEVVKFGNEDYRRNQLVASPALVASNLQLIRVLKESFGRGFVVKQ